MIIVIMGVAGSGKTTVGRELAASLRWPFHDADDLHPAANVAKMSAGTPLTAIDREPWLAALRALLFRIEAQSGDAVLACSSLSAAFRRRLAAGLRDLRYVYLRAAPGLIAARLGARRDHFFGSDLLDTQFDALEEPNDALCLDASEPVAALVGRIRRELMLGHPAGL